MLWTENGRTGHGSLIRVDVRIIHYSITEILRNKISLITSGCEAPLCNSDFINKIRVHLILPSSPTPRQKEKYMIYLLFNFRVVLKYLNSRFVMPFKRRKARFELQPIFCRIFYLYSHFMFGLDHRYWSMRAGIDITLTFTTWGSNYLVLNRAPVLFIKSKLHCRVIKKLINFWILWSFFKKVIAYRAEVAYLKLC